MMGLINNTNVTFKLDLIFLKFTLKDLNLEVLLIRKLY